MKKLSNDAALAVTLLVLALFFFITSPYFQISDVTDPWRVLMKTCVKKSIQGFLYSAAYIMMYVISSMLLFLYFSDNFWRTNDRWMK